MRSLSLHVSALNNAEYDLYTTCLRDLLDVYNDDNNSNGGSRPSNENDFDKAAVSIREARAWLRGRYSQLPLADIDNILKTILPNHSHSDVLTGGQFFAVMRLIMHVSDGKPVDSSLVFVQAYPDMPPSKKPPSQEVPRKLSATVPQPPPRPTPPPSVSSTQSQPPLIPPKPASNNPFRAAAASSSANPSGTQSARAKALLALEGKVQSQPPLPPRKPVVVVPTTPHPPPPPPRHASQNINHHHHMSTGLIGGGILKPLSSTPPTTNVLIQQSLQATRIAQSLKKADEKLAQERVLEVLKTSSPALPPPPPPGRRGRSISPTKLPGGVALSVSSGSGSSGSGGLSKSIPALPPRPTPGSKASTSTVTTTTTKHRLPTPPPHHPLPPTSPTDSYRSFDQIATAALPREREPPPRPKRPTSPFKSPPNPPMSLPEASGSGASSTYGPPPPTHPSRSRSRKSYVGIGAGATTTSAIDSSSDSSYPPSPAPGRADLTTTNVEGRGTLINSNTNTRLFRSRSMHQTSGPPSLPAPSVSGYSEGYGLAERRRRPESVQLTPRSSTSGSPFDSPLPSPLSPAYPSNFNFAAAPSSSIINPNHINHPSSSLSTATYVQPQPSGPTNNNKLHNLSRHLSLSSPARSRNNGGGGESSRFRTRGQDSLSDSPFLQKTLTALEQARYKAEAGIAPKRGFLPHNNPSYLIGGGSSGGGNWLIGERERQSEEPLMVRDDFTGESLGAESFNGEGRGGEGLFGDESEIDIGDRDERRGRVGGGAGQRVNGVGGVGTGREWMYERDGMKMPAGDGWKPL
ncbi:hypothetical protein ABKN59_004083 [Abortiporus biennis]